MRTVSSPHLGARALPLPLSHVMLVGALLGALMGAAPALAHKRFAKKEGVECKECHENPEGGGSRNLIGQYYQAKGELPLDRTPETMKRVQDTVDRFMLDVMARPAVIRWSHTAMVTPATAGAPVAAPPIATSAAAPVAADAEVLRRLSLDLRFTVPSLDDQRRLASGAVSLDQMVDQYIASNDFNTAFLVFYRDLARPRTGDYNKEASLTFVDDVTSDGKKVLHSAALPLELGNGKCRASNLVSVSPWWDRRGSHYACKDTANADVVVTDGARTIRCDTEQGQATGRCGCGPYMVFCYPAGVKEKIIHSMKEETARIALEVLDKGLPYGTVVTSTWTMLDGYLEFFYARLRGELATLNDPDVQKPWRRVERGPMHAGMLSTPELFNFYYNGRRWSQRIFEHFFCHEVFPDFDLLDDTRDAGLSTAVPYRDSPLLEPSLTVTESRPCAACHLQLDGLARVKDRWDPFGNYYEKSPRGIEIPQRAVFLGQEVDGLSGFGKVLAESDVFKQCAVTQLWNKMTGHRFKPEEEATRAELMQVFTSSGENIKATIKAIVNTKEYRSRANLKLMTREVYQRAMGRATDVAWRVGDKLGWDLFYDKVGGLDYRKIEQRDIRPGTGHSLVLMKAAAESCAEAVTRDIKRTKDKRFVVTGAEDVEKSPSSKELDATLAGLYARALARPFADVTEPERETLRKLFHKVQSKSGPADGYRSVCAAIYGSLEFELY